MSAHSAYWLNNRPPGPSEELSRTHRRDGFLVAGTVPAAAAWRSHSVAMRRGVPTYPVGTHWNGQILRLETPP
ncbi:hypothetical protein [Mycobacterium sp.]|uniref:hypothetical protein n=1 Tax=Mycobacterium sp. TaxID=1785 RepID=UPI002C8F140D|nr:hypothetical protein [Mycobacterium sp.]HTQ22510.1 hypothetical protein [Mycobacterium sp.]